MKYVDLVIDNNTTATDSFYSYACEFDDVKPGNRVRVPFSIHDREVDGFVVKVSEEAPAGVKRFKKVIRICEDQHLTPEALETALWMRTRYICRYIEAIKCFLPGHTQAKRKTKDIFADLKIEPDSPKLLTEDQKAALGTIKESFELGKPDIFLLHGVTGSGKTEVYLQACAAALEKDKQVIILVPEISLTPQTVSRFVNRFGRDSVAVLHSKLTPAQRSVEYAKIERGDVRLVIGARSAVFAPFTDIGMIIIDEEHETSYKSDKSPKYDAMEVAVKRAMAHGCPVILGSATPAVKDYYRCGQGLFRLLELPKRYNENPLPKVRIVDMTLEVRSGNRSLFSKELTWRMEDCFAKGKQVILFINRRGYSSFVSCRECGYTLKCPDCGIAMTYHKDRNACVCHYCGRTAPVPPVCPECGSRIIGRFGAGTQQIEEKAKELFPERTVARLDLDTVSRKGTLEKVLDRFKAGKIDILIGTQIIAKGHDFPNVGLVGIVSADVSLNIPDFRSAERTFQLLTQAAGRAGRGDDPGEVVIQTYSPDHPALRAAARHDYAAFYEGEIAVRKAVSYPPYSDIFQIVVSGEDERAAERDAERWADRLRNASGGAFSVLGPAISPINKQSGKYRYQVLVKSPGGMRREVSRLIIDLKKRYEESKGTQLVTSDVNPYSFM